MSDLVLVVVQDWDGSRSSTSLEEQRISDGETSKERNGVGEGRK